jgi:hypothetical protein
MYALGVEEEEPDPPHEPDGQGDRLEKPQRILLQRMGTPTTISSRTHTNPLALLTRQTVSEPEDEVVFGRLSL